MVLEFFGGAITYTDYLDMPGEDRREVLEHIVARVKQRERAERRQRMRGR